MTLLAHASSSFADSFQSDPHRFILRLSLRDQFRRAGGRFLFAKILQLFAKLGKSHCSKIAAGGFKRMPGAAQKFGIIRFEGAA